MTIANKKMTAFDPVRLQQFLAIPFERKEFTSTQIPRAWIKKAGVSNDHLDQMGVDLTSIPDWRLSRQEVLNICRDQHVLVGYLCAMAWGGQTAMHAEPAWLKRSDIADVLEQIRAGSLTRAEAYELFCGDGEVKNLGASYFTKLLFFFSKQPNAYIMDQWTAKSINYLTKREVVILGPDTPTRDNTGANFEEYCSLVEQLRDLLAERGEMLTGAEVEQRLFSSGGRDSVAGEWRKIIRNHYRKKPVREPAVKEESKKARAERIFVENKNKKLTRQEMIKLFVDLAGLTPQGASTYYHNISKNL